MVLSIIIKSLQGNKGSKTKWLQLIKVIPIHHIEYSVKND